MKKLLVIMLSVLAVFSLSSCMTIDQSIELCKERSEIEYIEIYNVETLYTESDITALRSDNIPLCTLSAEQQETFLEELLLLDFEKETALIPIPMDGGYDYSGYVISVVYTDGSYDIIAEEGQFSLKVGTDGEKIYNYDHSDYCGDIPWSEFVEKYVEK